MKAYDCFYLADKDLMNFKLRSGLFAGRGFAFRVWLVSGRNGVLPFRRTISRLQV